MDINQLIIDLLEISQKNSISHYKRDRCADAATALSTLQAENEKLRADVVRFNDLLASYQNVLVPELRVENENLKERFEDTRLEWYAKGFGEVIAEVKRVRAELEQVKAERDAAKSTLAERIGVRGAEPITTAFGLPIDRLRELAQADREGRCVVLPCKPSDVTVYQLRNKKHARGIGVSPRHISCATVWAGGHYALHHQGQDDCLGRDFKKTWFLDKAEAEAALRREQDGNRI